MRDTPNIGQWTWTVELPGMARVDRSRTLLPLGFQLSHEDLSSTKEANSTVIAPSGIPHVSSDTACGGEAGMDQSCLLRVMLQMNLWLSGAHIHTPTLHVYKQ